MQVQAGRFGVGPFPWGLMARSVGILRLSRAERVCRVGRSTGCALTTLREGGLPRAFLFTPPPDHTDGCGVLLFSQYSRDVGEERGLIGIIPAPFVTHEEAVPH